MILLAEHDEPTTLAAKKKRQPSASSWATSTPKNRVWGFENTPSGRPSVEPQLSWENATGSVQYTYQIASGRAEWQSRDPIGEDGGINLYAYVGNNPANYSDPLGLLNPNGQWPLYSKQTFDGAVSQLSKSIRQDNSTISQAAADAAALEIMTEMTLWEGQTLNTLTNGLKDHPKNAAKIKALLKSIKDRADAKSKK